MLDVDAEVGVVFIKTRAAPDTPITTHDVPRVVEGNKLALRTHVTDKVKNVLTASKGDEYAQVFVKLLVGTVNETNDMVEFDADARTSHNSYRTECEFSVQLSYAYILSWNARGIAANYMDEYLRKLSSERPWETLLLPEAVYQRKI